MSQSGFHAHRLSKPADNPKEVAFAKQWDIEHDFEVRRSIVHHLVPDITDRDMKVAATVIQWLGSNVGMSFLEEVIKSSPEIQRYLSKYASR